MYGALLSSSIYNVAAQPIKVNNAAAEPRYKPPHSGSRIPDPNRLTNEYDRNF